MYPKKKNEMPLIASYMILFENDKIVIILFQSKVQ